MEKSIKTPLEDYVSINERPKKNCCRYTDEEKAERARISTRSYYYQNIEKERERKRKRLDYHKNKIV